MEDGIYRMSLTEGFLVLIVIGLWVLAVVNFVRKLERICNPQSIYLDYSIHNNNTSLSPSTLHSCYQNNLIQSTTPSPIHFIRATSEPAIDASPRTTIHMRSPSETCLHSKSSISQQMSSLSKLELDRSHTSINLPRHSGYQIHVETLSNKPKLLYRKRLPSIVKRSLLDLHRRALISNTSLNNSMARCVVITADNRTTTTTTRIPLMKKKYQRENAIDEDDGYKGKTVSIFFCTYVNSVIV